MLNTHCGSTINCQRPWGSPLDSMEEIISSQCPFTRNIHYRQINSKNSAFSMQFRYRICNALYDVLSTVRQ